MRWVLTRGDCGGNTAFGINLFVQGPDRLFIALFSGHLVSSLMRIPDFLVCGDKHLFICGDTGVSGNRFPPSAKVFGVDARPALCLATPKRTLGDEGPTALSAILVARKVLLMARGACGNCGHTT